MSGAESSGSPVSPTFQIWDVFGGFTKGAPVHGQREPHHEDHEDGRGDDHFDVDLAKVGDLRVPDCTYGKQVVSTIVPRVRKSGKRGTDMSAGTWRAAWVRSPRLPLACGRRPPQRGKLPRALRCCCSWFGQLQIRETLSEWGPGYS